MSEANQPKDEEVFQLGDFFQELIRYNLQKKKPSVKGDNDNQTNPENREGQDERQSKPDASRKQKRPMAFAPRMANPENIAFGPSEDGLQTRELEKGFEFSGKTTNFLIDGDSSYLKPTEYAFVGQKEQQESPDSKENDETMMFFQISEENLLSFFGTESSNMEVEDEEIGTEFDNFGNPIHKLDVKKLMQSLQDKQLELTTDFKEFAELNHNGKVLKLEGFLPPKEQDMQLVKHNH